MIKYTFEETFIKRYRNFYNSKVYKSTINSEYWEKHKKKISVKINNHSIYLSGDSGFYYPEQSIFYFFLKNIKIIYFRLKKFFSYFNLSFYFMLNYSKAFDAIFSGERKITDIDPGTERINYPYVAKKSPFKNSYQIKKDFKKNFKGFTNDHVIKSYYWFSILNSHIKIKKKLNVLEIGAGSGFLSALFLKKKKVNLTIIDLPETLYHSIPFFYKHFPLLDIIMPNEINAKKLENTNGKIIFLLPEQKNLLKKNSFDLVINTLSFQEMTKSEISEYFLLIYKTLKKSCFFFTTNRIEKTAPQDKAKSKLPDSIRFFEYPFKNKFSVIFFEVCQLFRLVQLDNCYIFLGKRK